MAVRLNQDGQRPFVGRERELNASAGILADEDRAGVALIGGESGMGKTRLVEETVALAPPDTVVVRGGAVPRATPIPFELIRSATAATPLVAIEIDDSPERPAEEVRSVAEALRVMHDGPTIFVFEDIHWADAESLEVIDRLLVAGPMGASILITYRPNALHPGHPTSVFLARAERRSNVVQFRLEPLRLDEVGDYLAASGRKVSSATVEHVHGRTGGNPLLLSELVAATSDDEDLTAGLPWTLAEMLRPEIERLPAAERSVAEAVAVLGVDVGFDLLAAAVDSSERELLGYLRGLVGKGILVESGPDQFGFRHDMVREAVADSLFTREHRQIHATVHDKLLAMGSDDVVALVAHATGAGRSKQAADAARDAAVRSLDNGRTQQALAFAEQALLEHTDDIGLLRVAVISGWMSAQTRPALHHLDRWEELVSAASPERAEVLHHRVRLLWDEGEAAAADRAAEDLAAMVETMELSVASAQAMADLAQHYMLSGRDAESIAMADRAIVAADAIGSAADASKRQAMTERASARLSHQPDRATVIQEVLEIVDICEAAGDYVVASRALHNVPIEHPSIDAASHVERMRQNGERAGMRCMATENHRYYLLVVAKLDGDREAFEALLETVLEDLGHLPKFDLLASQAALDAGDFGLARELAERLPVVGDPDHYQGSWRTGMLAYVELDAGNGEPMRDWMRNFEPGHMAKHLALGTVVASLSSFLNAGLHDELREFLALEAIASAFEPAFEAIQAELAGEHDRADRLYVDALELGMCQTVFEQVELHLARARVAEALGKNAQVHLEAAAKRISKWPGRRFDYVSSLLDGPRPPESPSVLTPREREVAQLLTRGLTNGGIADELYISTKTASVHVSNILAKLTMSSRTEIAAWVTEGGLDPANA